MATQPVGVGQYDLEPQRTGVLENGQTAASQYVGLERERGIMLTEEVKEAIFWLITHSGYDYYNEPFSSFLHSANKLVAYHTYQKSKELSNESPLRKIRKILEETKDENIKARDDANNMQNAGTARDVPQSPGRVRD